MLNLHRYISGRYFRSRKGFISVVSGFSLAGILLGVAALIVVMSVMNGFREELLGRILGMGGHATVQISGMTAEKAEEVSAKITNLSGVESAHAFVQGQALTMNRGGASGVLLRGISTQSSGIYIQSADKIISGNIAHLERPNTVAIGKDLARTLGAGVGTAITLVAPSGSTTPFGFIPQMMKVQVVAIFDVGMQMYNSGWVYSSIPTAQKFLKLGDLVTGVDIKVSNPLEIEKSRDLMAEELNSEDPFILTWKNSNQQFFEALEVERVSMFIILTLIIVVAAFNIVTGQTMSVNDKRGDIAILRTMGARRSDILKIFILGGSLIGFLGTIFGVVAGLLVVFNLQNIVSVLESLFGVSIFSGDAYFLDKLPAVVDPLEILVITAVSLGLSVLASVYPAMRASNLDPVEVLRSE